MRLRVTLPLGEPTRGIRPGDAVDFRPVWLVPGPAGQPEFRVLARVAEVLRPDAFGPPCVRFVCDHWRTYEDDWRNDVVAHALLHMADKILRVDCDVPVELCDGCVGYGAAADR